MTIFLFTDFGAADLYVGQLRAVLQEHAPGVPVIDLLHEAPAYNVLASAHLLAALARRVPPGSVMLAVVDPGVGGARDAVAVNAGNSWIVGPDNGLLAVLAARARACDLRRIIWRPEELSASFHGRDLFAPIAAAIARGEFPADRAETMARLSVDLGGDELAEIIYVDHYGNAFTGLRAGLAHDARIVAAGRAISYARVYSEVASGELFWHENSLALIEIAANGRNAAARLRLGIGQPVAVDC